MNQKTTLKVVALIIGLIMISCNSESQKKEEKSINQEAVTNNQSMQLSITDQTIKKDAEGNVISNEKFNEYLSSGEYLATPIIKNGKIVEAQLQKASKEQVAELMKMFKENASNDEIGKKAPDFEVTDIAGKTYKLKDLKDKTVVLNFWFTTCKPCILEMPELNELVKENKDVVFIGLATDKEKRVKSFLEKHPFNYHIIPNAKDVADLYKVNSFPTHYIIKDGIVQNKFIGLSSDIKEKIQNAINGKIDNKKEVSKKDKEVSNKPIMLNSDSDIRNEKGEKLGMMDAVQMINSQEYTMENAKDKDGKEFILIKKR